MTFNERGSTQGRERSWRLLLLLHCGILGEFYGVDILRGSEECMETHGGPGWECWGSGRGVTLIARHAG